MLHESLLQRENPLDHYGVAFMRIARFRKLHVDGLLHDLKQMLKNGIHLSAIIRDRLIVHRLNPSAP